MDIALIVSIITAIAAVVGLIINVKELMKSREERVRWQQKTDDTLELFGEKIEEHNGYAKKFQECAVGIAEIKGKLGI